MKLDRFINRPVLSTVISIVVVILGILGLVSLPVSQYPDIAPPTIRVTTTYTGANAQTILNSVIAPLEEQINGVEDMMYMSSTATNTGEASIEVLTIQVILDDSETFAKSLVMYDFTFSEKTNRIADFRIFYKP